jgi:hypothetical protein
VQALLDRPPEPAYGTPERKLADERCVRDYLATSYRWTAGELRGEIAKLKRELDDAEWELKAINGCPEINAEYTPDEIRDAEMNCGGIAQILAWHEMKLAEVTETRDRRDVRPPAPPARAQAARRPRARARGRERRRRAPARASSSSDGDPGEPEPPASSRRLAPDVDRRRAR